MDFLLTSTSNHASISLGFQHIYDDVGFFGFKNVLATAGGHRSMHADRWVQLPVLGFLIVFCNNHYSKMHRFWARAQDRQTSAMRNAPLWRGHTKQPVFKTNWHKTKTVSFLIMRRRILHSGLHEVYLWHEEQSMMSAEVRLCFWHA